MDRTVALDAVGGGAYRASVSDVERGQWDIVARATSDEGAVFEAERRVMLK
jgi:nitrogen fixation protein FixH